MQSRTSLAATLALAALMLAAHPAFATAAPPTLVVLGDSLSAGYGLKAGEGWVSLLADRMAREGYGYRVVNASVSGETTAGGLARLPHVIDREHPALLVVELGANDGLRGLPVPALAANLTAMARAGRTAGARVVLVGMRLPPNYGAEYTSSFAAAFAAVARAEHLPLVPFLLAPIASDATRFQADGLHPVATAEPALLDTVWPVLAPLLAAPARGAPAGTRTP
jgi:acyl-CoA thioesterase-1